MREIDSIGFSTLQLDGDAQAWWYHGLVMLGHVDITSYTKFMRRHVERFDQKDLELHFQELANLRQTGSAQAYMAELQRLVMIVSDILESKLIMLFIEELAEPLHGWVRAYWHVSLQDSINWTRDMLNAVLKTRAPVPSKPTFPWKGKDIRSPQKE